MDSDLASVPHAVYVIWAVMLGITLILFVPAAISLLHRTYRASHSIRRYLDEMRAAAEGIGGNTSAISALEETALGARQLLEVGGQIKERTGSIARILGERADTGAGRD